MGAKEERYHPSQKPIPVMARIAKDITTLGNTILDPFMGSGSTGCAAVLEGFEFVGIEKEEEYYEIANLRIEHYKNQDKQLSLID